MSEAPNAQPWTEAARMRLESLRAWRQGGGELGPIYEKQLADLEQREARATLAGSDNR